MFCPVSVGWSAESEMMNAPDAFLVKGLLSGEKHEIPSTAQNKRIKVGEMVTNSPATIRKAAAVARKARQSGKKAINDKFKKMKIHSL